MQFTETNLNGAWIIEPVPDGDARGFFARSFCEREFAEHGLETHFVQHSVSGNIRAGTIRGLHFQREQHAEVKVINCLKGAILDVIVDLRPDSPQFCRWQGVELTEDNKRRLYVPKGFAHGFQTLRDDCEIQYLISEFYKSSAAAGIRYDDPAFAIRWPLPISVISENDLSWPDFR